MNAIERATFEAVKEIVNEKFENIIKILNQFSDTHKRHCFIQQIGDFWCITSDNWQSREEYITYEGAILKFLEYLVKHD